MYEDYIEDENKINECGYCGEPCQYDFCNKDHKIAYFED